MLEIKYNQREATDSFTVNQEKNQNSQKNTKSEKYKVRKIQSQQNQRLNQSNKFLVRFAVNMISKWKS